MVEGVDYGGCDFVDAVEDFCGRESHWICVGIIGRIMVRVSSICWKIFWAVTTNVIIRIMGGLVTVGDSTCSIC